MSEKDSAATGDGLPSRSTSSGDCSETVMRIFEFLDGEMGPEDRRRMQEHLERCDPCLREYQLDQALKLAIKRSCGQESAPVALRTTILQRITTVRVETYEL